MRKMRGGEVCCFATFALGLALYAAGLVVLPSYFSSDRTFGFDLRWRRNETVCAHQGVNSFHVWNRDVTAAGFRPAMRPDMPDVPEDGSKKTVHAYPAWHTAIFWWYGWFPETVCLGMMACLFGLCLSLVFRESLGVVQVEGLMKGLTLAFLAVAVCGQALRCFFVLNYGMMIVAGSVLLFRLLKRDRQVVAGLVWAVMMVKPQTSMLFFWPILFMRKYRTIATAVMTCLALTAVMGAHYGESPVDLILQIPRIGAPYGDCVPMNKFLEPLFGPLARHVWMALCFLVCGGLCFGLRTSDKWYVRCAPVALLTPLWTYSNSGDGVILLIWYLVVAERAFAAEDGKERSLWLAYALMLVVTQLFCYFWDSARDAKLFNAAGKGWIYHMVAYGMVAWAFVLLAKICRCRNGEIVRCA